jgi:hypothetical protein
MAGRPFRLADFAHEEVVELTPLPRWAEESVETRSERIREMVAALVEEAEVDPERMRKILRGVQPTDRPRPAAQLRGAEVLLLCSEVLLRGAAQRCCCSAAQRCQPFLLAQRCRCSEVPAVSAAQRCQPFPGGRRLGLRLQGAWDGDCAICPRAFGSSRSPIGLSSDGC